MHENEINTNACDTQAITIHCIAAIRRKEVNSSEHGTTANDDDDDDDIE
jgi:hypothetical protein